MIDELIEVRILATGRYTGRVDKIVEARRDFTSQGGRRYVHDIFFVGVHGLAENAVYRGEHVTQYPTQNDFEVGEECCFQVTNQDRKEIAKCITNAPVIGAGTSSNQPAEVWTPAPREGTSNTHIAAMGFAKDIMVAQIRGAHITGSEENFMEKLSELAWRIKNWLDDPKEPLPF